MFSPAKLKECRLTLPPDFSPKSDAAMTQETSLANNKLHLWKMTGPGPSDVITITTDCLDCHPAYL